MEKYELESMLNNANNEFNASNFSASRAHYKRLYDDGIQNFALNVGETYYAEKKYEKALSWYRKVKSDQHLIEATLNMALMFDEGKGTPIDHGKSYQLIIGLPENSTPFREYYLSVAYVNGNAVKRDLDSAASYAIRAFEQGLLEALSQLAAIRKEQGRYLSWFFLKTSLLMKVLKEIIRIYVLGKKDNYVPFRIFSRRPL